MPLTDIRAILRSKPKAINIVGSDSYLVDGAIDEIKKIFVPDVSTREFNISRIDCSSISAVRAAIMEEPLFSQHRVVLLDGDASKVDSRNASSIVVSLTGSLKGDVAILDCRVPRGRRVRPVLRKMSKDAGIQLSKEDIVLFALKFPGSLHTVRNILELMKLHGEPYKPSLEYFLNFNSAFNIWSLTKAVLEGKTALSLSLLLKLLNCGESEVRIISALSKQARLVAFLQSGIDMSSMASKYELMRIESLRGAIRVEDAIAVVASLVDAEFSIKSGDKFALIEAVIKLTKAAR